MLSNLFANFNWTRDDLKWAFGMLAAIIVGLATLGTSITDYGIPLKALPYLRLGSLLVGIVSAKMATSGLPGGGPTSSNLLNKLPSFALIAALGLGALTLSACGAKSSPQTPAPPDPMTAVRAGAKIAVDGLNAVSTIGTTALNLAKADPQISPAALTNLTNGVRAYDCALLDEGNLSPMPAPATGTVTDSCHAHGDPMLGIITKINAAGSAVSLQALELQGVSLAVQAITSISSTGAASLASFVATAQGILATIQTGVTQ